jgi:hypothetical protein
MAPVAQASVTSSGFISRVSRFASSSATPVPGPGAYQSPQTFKPPKPLPGQAGANTAATAKAPGNADSGVQWVRVSAPPSIPTAHQSYGYEESPDGDLVLQSSGVITDSTPGPGVRSLSVGLFVPLMFILTHSIERTNERIDV